MNRKSALDRDQVIDFVMSCWDEEAGYTLCLPDFASPVDVLPSGAFASHPDHDAHIHSTLSAIQILLIHDALDRLNVPRVVDCEWLSLRGPPPIDAHLPNFLVISSLQQPSGVFAGDKFGETDTRFLYCGVAALSLLGHLDKLDKEQTVSYIRQCKNFDGGYGSVVGAESHSAQGRKTLMFHIGPRS